MAETQIWDNESQCYRRAVLYEALTHVRLSERITGDSPFGDDTIAEPGVYEAHLNPHGAVSIIAGNGKLLGLKPGEFEWVGTHAPTPAPQYDWNTEPDPLLAELKYIAESPAQEHGGFHPRVVVAAQRAIERIAPAEEAEK